MVDANGKIYERRHDNNMTDKQEDWDADAKKYVDAKVVTVINLSLYHHLN
jgi:hypothetical protein